MATIYIHACHILPHKKANNQLVCGIVQLNLIIRTRENWANLKLYTNVIFCRSVVLSSFLLISGQNCSCHLVNTHNVVFQQDTSLNNCHLKGFIDKLWTEITGTLMPTCMKIDSNFSGQ